MDPIAMEDFYADVKITSTHLENALALAKLQVGKKWASLGEPWRKGQFRVSSLVSSAYQDWQLNAVTLLAGIQQFPIFDISFPPYLLFGGLGSIIGHETTHGFDTNGHHYDTAGNLSS
ncbi:hypothetical protein S7711_10201 [Stachybotrys chartarum IBT 7711]|uniref:Peptidase M13 C-terminal domain-containing protein n=1 Tax=Stachybotrys chartarum (strain CBS 109288 / IBT 7711) TaxID=1280523 RepID=A0A084B0C4_STACB|nr:hypothetical protein S7711_10201 [Stachybotrys chartarum IBT 7711]